MIRIRFCYAGYLPPTPTVGPLFARPTSLPTPGEDGVHVFKCSRNATLVERGVLRPRKIFCLFMEFVYRFLYDSGINMYNGAARRRALPKFTVLRRSCLMVCAPSAERLALACRVWRDSDGVQLRIGAASGRLGLV